MVGSEQPLSAWSCPRTFSTAGGAYAEIFRIFDEYHHVIDRVSLLGDYRRPQLAQPLPPAQPTGSPLLFDKKGELKPAFWAIVDPYRPWYVNKAEYLGAAVFETETGSRWATLIPGQVSAGELKGPGDGR